MRRLKSKPIDYLLKEEVEMIHANSLDILESTGIKIDCNEAQRLLIDNGAEQKDGRILIPRELVLEQLRQAPSQFKLHSFRNPERDIVIGGDYVCFAPGYGAPRVLDMNHGPRPGRLEDYDKFTRLAGASENICNMGYDIVDPQDVPIEIKHLEMMHLSIKNGDKPFMGSPYGKQQAKDSIKMAEILAGDKEILFKKPSLLCLINTISPLTISREMTEGLMTYAKANQAVLIASLPMTGATSPITLPGTMVQVNAEVLAGITIAQLVRKGAPVIYGCASAETDMSTGTGSIGTAKAAASVMITAQLARYYELPSRAGGILTDSNIPDAQAGYESAMIAMATVFSGINFVLHTAGILQSYNMMSYEKFIIDEDILNSITKIACDFDVNENSLAIDVIKENAEESHFLQSQHTLKHLKTEILKSMVSERIPYGNWVKKGSNPTHQRAREVCSQILKCYEPPKLDKGINQELMDYINQRKKAHISS